MILDAPGKKLWVTCVGSPTGERERDTIFVLDRDMVVEVWERAGMNPVSQHTLISTNAVHVVHEATSFLYMSPHVPSVHTPLVSLPSHCFQ